jgi:hypothetical protein
MFEILCMVLIDTLSWLRPKHQLVLKILALRHQITVLKSQIHKPKLRPGDRFIWITLWWRWPDWQKSLLLFQPQTVIAWHHLGIRLF